MDQSRSPDDEKTTIAGDVFRLVHDQDDSRKGAYRLSAPIGSGGMGKVYLGCYMAGAFRKVLALKRMHRHLAKKRRVVEMFFDEASISARINHPNVCSVFDFGRADGAYYIAMDYVLGETWASVTRQARLDESLFGSRDYPALIARLAIQAAEGLHAAHTLTDESGQALHVVHRDVTPQNLFVGYDGSLRVMDFGIAKAKDRLHKTTIGTLKGRFAYMAPEYCAGKGVDARSDQWSLGVVCWEALTGDLLFQREDAMSTMHAVLNGDVPAPSDYSPHVMPDLDAVILRALDRDPDRRFPTIRDFAASLEQVLVRHYGAVGISKVADWMRRLFPDGESSRRAMMADAYAGRVALDDSSSPDDEGEEEAWPLERQVARNETRVQSPISRRRRRKSRTESLDGTVRYDSVHTVSYSDRDTVHRVVPISPLAKRSVPPGACAGESAQSDAATLVDFKYRLSTPDPVVLPSAFRASRIAAAAIVFVLVAGGAIAVVTHTSREPSLAIPTPRANEGPEPLAARMPLAQPSALRRPEEPAAEPVPKVEPPEPTLTPEAHGDTGRDPKGKPRESRHRPREPRPGPAPSKADPTSEERAPLPRPQRGIVLVKAERGWAEIYVDGRLGGRTPQRLVLSPGEHTIEVRPYGSGSSTEMRVRAVAGEVAIVPLTLPTPPARVAAALPER